MGYHRLATPDLGRIFRGETVTGLSEWQLLERYLEQRDEVAFEAIVARHGPMVLGVCRRMLAEQTDVEDAFQATFLVLVARCASSRPARRDRALALWRGQPGRDAGPVGRGAAAPFRAGYVRNRGRRDERPLPIAKSPRSSTRSSPACRRNTAIPSCSATWKARRTKRRPGSSIGRSAR